MEKKSKNPGRIAAKDLPPVKSWILPRVQSTHVVRSPFAEKERKQGVERGVVEEVAEVKPLTVEAIEKIRSDAHQEGLTQGHQEGLEKGLQEGRAKGEELGYQTGLKQAEDEMNRLRDRLSGLIRQLDAPVAEQQAQLESALLRLVIDTATCVIGQQLSTRPELMKQAVSEALAALPHGESGLCFSVNPEDAALLEGIREREQGSWTIRADEDVQQGGLQIKGANSYLDYSVEHRFKQVIEQVLAQGEQADEPEPRP